MGCLIVSWLGEFGVGENIIPAEKLDAFLVPAKLD
jgi:hypothetical protein